MGLFTPKWLTNTSEAADFIDGPSNPRENIDYAAGKCGDNNLPRKGFRDARHSEAVRKHALNLSRSLRS